MNKNIPTQTLRFVSFLAFALVMACGSPKENPEEAYTIMPEPANLMARPGVFELSAETSILATNEPGVAEVKRYFKGLISAATGFNLEEAGNADIEFKLDQSITHPEAYQLSVSPDKVLLTAGSSAGLFYGVQTLRQLLPYQIEGEGSENVDWYIPAVEIEDEPRFSYRGMHLDVGRHFFPPEFIKEYIDLIAMHKMNTFHWHLTEDQGWRIEIKKYPRLTEVGAWRDGTLIGHLGNNPRKYDGERYGGFYTQEEVKEIVAYAAERHVTVIPEIELPGHSLAALAAYPGLGCTAGPFAVAQHWGVFEDIYCPKEETFSFLEDVLTEVMALFPGKYIHIGGDEAPKSRWKASRVAQDVIRKEGLKDEFELQSYFIQRIEKFLNSKGRRIIGWDEILEGGLAPNATVMSWRGEAGGIEAAKEGHDVVMTPGSHCYFDFYQSRSPGEPLAIGGFTPLEKVYHYEPVPKELTPAEAKHVLGAQGNVWTEYMKTQEHVEYMILPRMTALSEVLWSSAKSRDWERFQEKLKKQYLRYDELEYNYFVHYPDLTGFRENNAFVDQGVLEIDNPIEGASVYITTDGSEPGISSTSYTGPVTVTEDTQFRIAAIGKKGNVLKQYRADFSKKSYKNALNLELRQHGLDATYYEGSYRNTDQIKESDKKSTYSPTDFSFPDDVNEDQFAIRFEGYFKAEEDGLYTFSTASDDGSVLYIGDELVVDNDGLHGEQEKFGQVFLRAGLHPIKVVYFELGGGNVLRVNVETPGKDKQGLSKYLYKQ